jgi:hypothetical protein
VAYYDNLRMAISKLKEDFPYLSLPLLHGGTGEIRHAAAMAWQKQIVVAPISRQRINKGQNTAEMTR